MRAYSKRKTPGSCISERHFLLALSGQCLRDLRSNPYSRASTTRVHALLTATGKRWRRRHHHRVRGMAQPGSRTLLAISGRIQPPEKWLESEQCARRKVAVFADRAGPTFEGPGDTERAQTVGWRRGEGNEPINVGEYSRLFDMVVVGQHTPERRAVVDLFESVLFKGGRRSCRHLIRYSAIWAAVF